MYQQRRRQLSQNFLPDQRLWRQLVSASSVSADDTVLEIGPGKGFLTTVLLHTGARVQAVELDAKLVLHLRQFFAGQERLTIQHGDILTYQLPTTPYKVFANIPFAIAGQIVRKLLAAPTPPTDSYLVVQADFATRLSGLPHQNQFSLKYQPWYSFEIVHHFRRSDFVPQPRVDSVLWRIRQREQALLPLDEIARYHRFIEVAFAQGQPLAVGLRAFLTPRAIRAICASAQITPQMKPGYLTLTHWLTLYRLISPRTTPTPKQHGRTRRRAAVRRPD